VSAVGGWNEIEGKVFSTAIYEDSTRWLSRITSKCRPWPYHALLFHWCSEPSAIRPLEEYRTIDRVADTTPLLAGNLPEPVLLLTNKKNRNLPDPRQRRISKPSTS
jgi:hypothetical protein